MNRLTRKVALISGAARGLGAEFARGVAAEGASVVIGDVLDEDGRRLAEDIGQAARFVHLDVRDYEQWRNAVELSERSFGRLDILVNNAGVVGAPRSTSTRWRTGTSYRHQPDGLVLRDPRGRGGTQGVRRGSIINISSDAGLQGYGGITGYNTSKFGLRGLTKSAALDLGPYNVRVNTVHPGLIRTPLLGGMEFPQDHVALHRMGEMSEIANLVVFLASDEASFSTGGEFIADGGESASLAHPAR